MKRVSSALCLAMISGIALGQSVNVDLNSAAGSVPANTFGGAAGQAGTWNAVTATGAGATINLVGLNGASAGLTLKATSTNGNDGGDLGSSNFGSLMDDYGLGFTQNGDVEVEVNGLDQGFYRVFVYAALDPLEQSYVDGFGFTNWHTNYIAGTLGAAGIGSSSTVGPTAFNTFGVNKTHVVLNATVGAGAPMLKIRVSSDIGNGLARCAFNGLQIVKMTATRLYVDDNAAGLNNGSSWTDAMTSLQEAIAVSKASNGLINEIWVAQGSYKPGLSRGLSFKMHEGLKLYGGFYGHETSIDQRVPNNVNSTSYLEGNIGTAAFEDNSFHIVDASGVTGNTVIDGFTVRYGCANGSGDDAYGGGLFAESGSPSISNMIFRNNSATYGGGIAINGAAAILGPNIYRCNIRDNFSTEDGAGIWYSGGNGGFLAPVLSVAETRFYSNDCDGFGGAAHTVGDAYFTNCLIWGNGAPLGGGAIFHTGGAGSDLFVRSCTVASNRSTFGSGGIRVVTGSLNMRNSIAWNNFGPALMLSSIKNVNAVGANGSAIDYSCVQTESLTPVTGTGNIKGVPMFTNMIGQDLTAGTEDDLLMLEKGSPCVDVGDNSWAMGDDLGSGSRVEDGNLDGIAVVDMGAYELERSPCPADFNLDLVVDDADFVIFLAGYNLLICDDPAMPAGCPADLDNNNLVDDADFVIFLQAYNFLECP